MKSIFNLLRVRQYYKNALIFVGIFFSQRLFDISLYFSLLIGFILLCCASSFNYIINDIRDIKSDRNHPEKLKKKPLASKELPVYFAVILIIILILLILIGIITLSFFSLIPSLNFALMVLLIIATGQIYNLFLKNYAFIDILILSLGYLWRALAGCFLIEEYVSAWLFLAIFEVALFLSIGKRRADLSYLGREKAIEHKRVYKQYSLELLNQFYTIISSCLFMTYSLYLIFNFKLFDPNSVKLYEYIAIFTIPIALYIIMRYNYLTMAKPKVARSPEKAFFDKGIIISAFILLLILIISFYFDQFIEFFNLGIT
ncbi:MAG: UbiA prenyltransferase family protein [Promethearchaeota archaeon]